MNAVTQLRQVGQTIWLDTMSHQLLESGLLQRCIDDYAISGVTSNPTILSHAMADTPYHDAVLRAALDRGDVEAQRLVYACAVEDARHAADLLRPAWNVTQGAEGWVSIEVPPEHADHADSTVEWTRRLHQQVDRPNVFIKVPGTGPDSLPPWLSPRCANDQRVRSSGSDEGSGLRDGRRVMS